MVCARMSRLTGPLGFSAQVLPTCAGVVQSRMGIPGKNTVSSWALKRSPWGPRASPPRGPPYLRLPSTGVLCGLHTAANHSLNDVPPATPWPGILYIIPTSRLPPHPLLWTSFLLQLRLCGSPHRLCLLSAVQCQFAPSSVLHPGQTTHRERRPRPVDMWHVTGCPMSWTTTPSEI